MIHAIYLTVIAILALSWLLREIEQRGRFNFFRERIEARDKALANVRAMAERIKSQRVSEIDEKVTLPAVVKKQHGQHGALLIRGSSARVRRSRFYRSR